MIRSRTFTITRAQLVRAASKQYLRRMWPVFIAFPVFGILAMALGQNQYLKAIGFLALLWPFSIPGRVAIASWSKAKRLMRPTWVLLENDTLYFGDEAGEGGMKLPLDQIRRCDKRDGFYILETRGFNFALIPTDAIEAADRPKFEYILGIR